MPTDWKPGDRVYCVETGDSGTVTRVTPGYAAVDLDEGSFSVFGVGDLDWYTLPAVTA